MRISNAVRLLNRQGSRPAFSALSTRRARALLSASSRAAKIAGSMVGASFVSLSCAPSLD